jgi:ABC-type branched-subunit amino acid transport system substrate-binding protein
MCDLHVRILVLSTGASSYGNRNGIPQLSFASSKSELSDKNSFPYFARTCPSDKEQARYLAEMVNHLNLTNVAVIAVSTDAFSASMAKDFIEA